MAVVDNENTNLDSGKLAGANVQWYASYVIQMLLSY